MDRVALGIGARRDESRFLLKDRDVGAVLDAVAQPTRRDRVDPAEDAFTDVGPAGSAHRAVHAEPRAVAGLVGQVCGVDEHLGGYAADIQAGAAVGARVHTAIDDRDLLVREAVIGQRVSAAGTDDDEVVHLFSIR